jgi:hypothetical protein
MENAGHQTTVHVKLDGRDPTATFVFLYQVVIMAHVTTLLSVIVKQAGRELSVTSPAVKIAPMDSVSHPMNVSAQMAGLVRTVIPVNVVLDANMAPVETIPSPASVKQVGKDFFVTNLLVMLIATMEFATPLGKQTQPTFVCASLDGKEQAVTFAGLTGDVPTRMLMPVTIPMNVSASTMKLMLRDFATTQS